MTNKHKKNAAIASQTHDVAVETDLIAKLIINNVDEKQFLGKNDVKPKQMTKQNNTLEVSKS